MSSVCLFSFIVENISTETGASGANRAVKEEIISLIRNSLGARVDVPVWKKKTQSKKSSSEASCDFFADGAWIYEHYLRSNTYFAAFAGTALYGPYNQTIPPQAYARISTGFCGAKDHFNWKLSYYGLYGHKLIEQSASLSLGYNF